MSTESAVFEVLENQRRERRAFDLAVQGARRIEAELRSLRKEMDELRANFGNDLVHLSFPDIESKASFNDKRDADEYTDELTKIRTAVVSSIATAKAGAHLRKVIEKAVSRAEKFSSSKSYEHLESRPRTLVQARNELAKDIDRIVSRLSGLVSLSDRVSVESLVSEILTTLDAARVNAKCDELRLAVQRANEKAEKSRIAVEAIEKVQDELRCLEGDDVQQMITRLDRLKDAPRRLDPDTISAAREVIELARRRDDRDYAGMVLREELEQLGYVVDDSFVNSFVEGRRSLVRFSEANDYRVVCRYESDSEQLDVYVAKLDGSDQYAGRQQSLRDQKIESKFCKDFETLRGHLQDRKIATRVVRRLPAGQRPLSVISDVTDTRPMAKSRKEGVQRREVRRKPS
jgi:hypothetical protein